MIDNDTDWFVSLYSTRLPLIQYFIDVYIKHYRLRSDPYVTQLIVNYLSQGKFANVDVDENNPELNRQ